MLFKLNSYYFHILNNLSNFINFSLYKNKDFKLILNIFLNFFLKKINNLIKFRKNINNIDILLNN